MVFNLLSGNDLQFRKQGVKKVANTCMYSIGKVKLVSFDIPFWFDGIKRCIKSSMVEKVIKKSTVLCRRLNKWSTDSAIETMKMQSVLYFQWCWRSTKQNEMCLYNSDFVV